MKKQILVMMAAAMLLGGCAGKAEADDVTIFEKTGEETQVEKRRSSKDERR